MRSGLKKQCMIREILEQSIAEDRRGNHLYLRQTLVWIIIWSRNCFPIVAELSWQLYQKNPRKVTPDAVMSSAEATTSRGCDGVRSFAESVIIKVNNSLARVRASILVSSPSRIKGFYDDYDKTFYRPMAIANSSFLISHMGEALRGLLEIQLRHPEVMAPNVSLMNRHLYTLMSVVNEDENQVLNTNLVGVVKGTNPEWPCVPWAKAQLIMIHVHFDGRWFLLKLIARVNKCIIFDLQRRHDPNCKALDEDIRPILINDARLLSLVGNNPHPERSWYIKMHDEFKAQIKHEDSGAFVLAAAGYSLTRDSAHLVLKLDDRLVTEFRFFLTCNMFDNRWTLF
ncbi:uncharacterized protein [Henckelia pumila]|uniref:uncharacterized protein isoform X3 n=1 Tax=Henckelia pumila TaxID=405737 RepID=UPI003C6E16EB